MANSASKKSSDSFGKLDDISGIDEVSRTSAKDLGSSSSSSSFNSSSSSSSNRDSGSGMNSSSSSTGSSGNRMGGMNSSSSSSSPGKEGLSFSSLKEGVNMDQMKHTIQDGIAVSKDALNNLKGEFSRGFEEGRRYFNQMKGDNFRRIDEDLRARPWAYVGGILLGGAAIGYLLGSRRK